MTRMVKRAVSTIMREDWLPDAPGSGLVGGAKAFSVFFPVTAVDVVGAYTKRVVENWL